MEVALFFHLGSFLIIAGVFRSIGFYFLCFIHTTQLPVHTSVRRRRGNLSSHLSFASDPP
jgi:hypothetical protein